MGVVAINCIFLCSKISPCKRFLDQPLTQDVSIYLFKAKDFHTFLRSSFIGKISWTGQARANNPLILASLTDFQKWSNILTDNFDHS